MSALRRKGERILYAGVGLLGLGWMVGFTVSVGGVPTDPPPDETYVVQLVLAAVFVAIPWLIAVRLLWRRWWARNGERLEPLDPPARLLAAAVGSTPDSRRGWGAAMAAELGFVHDPRERWRFAVGCAWAALCPPYAGRLPVLATGTFAAAAVIATGLAVGEVLPTMRDFGIAFVGLVGILATLAMTRSAKVPRPTAISVAGLVAVAACVAATAYFLVRFPIAATHLPPAAAVFLAAMLAGALWLTFVPPRGLTAHHLARTIGIGTATVLGAGLLVTSRTDLRVEGDGILGYLLWVSVPIVFAGSALAGAATRSFGAGVQAAVWTVVLASLATFAIALLEAVRWFDADQSLILAADWIPLHAVGENVRNFTWGLLLYGCWWLPFGVIGAAIGARLMKRVGSPS